MGRIIEAGHYYSSKGPTEWSKAGWRIMQGVLEDGDKTMLFVDDIHPLECLHCSEFCLSTVDFSPNPDFLVLESALSDQAQLALSKLQKLGCKKRARKGAGGKWCCSGFPLTDEAGNPNCVLLDAGLTLHKQSLGFLEGVNILPHFYEEEQRRLMRLLGKILPNFFLRVVLFDLEGKYWEM